MGYAMYMQIDIQISEGIGGSIVHARSAAGLSQQDLANKIGTTQSAISRWERGHDEPRMTSLVDIFRACGKRLSLHIDDDVDRSQIRQQLAMTPEQRLMSVVNVSRTRASVRRV
jgi:transcriptional regulator with XRE-family HTH domain